MHKDLLDGRQIDNKSENHGRPFNRMSTADHIKSSDRRITLRQQQSSRNQTHIYCDIADWSLFVSLFRIEPIHSIPPAPAVVSPNWPTISSPACLTPSLSQLLICVLYSVQYRSSLVEPIDNSAKQTCICRYINKCRRYTVATSQFFLKIYALSTMYDELPESCFAPTERRLQPPPHHLSCFCLWLPVFSSITITEQS